MQKPMSSPILWWMKIPSNYKSLLIDYGALNHMMAERDSFSSLETNKSIPIHMGDESTIILEGQGTVDLENGYFSNVLYVPFSVCKFLW